MLITRERLREKIAADPDDVCVEVIPAASSLPADVVALVKQVEDLLIYADLMPKKTPAPGACSTEHDFRISAGAVWGLGERVTKTRAALTPFADRVAGEEQ